MLETVLEMSCTFNVKPVYYKLEESSLESYSDEWAEVEMHPVGHSKSSFIRRLQTIEELPDSTAPTEPRLEETEGNLDEADLQSELSYASAYSSPMASVQSLDNSDGYQLQETTV